MIKLLEGKWFPWALAVLLLLILIFCGRCQIVKNQKTLIETAKNEAIVDHLAEINDDLLAEIKKINEDAQEAIQDSLDKSDEAITEANKIKTLSVLEVRKLKASSKSWESKFLTLEGEYIKLSDKCGIFATDNDQLRVTLAKIKLDLYEMAENEVALKKNMKIIEDKFNAQVKLTKEAAGNKCTVEKVIAVVLASALIYKSIKGD